MEPKKLIVVLNGVRASTQVHEGKNAQVAAESEANAIRQRLVESKTAPVPTVEVKELLLG